MKNLYLSLVIGENANIDEKLNVKGRISGGDVACAAWLLVGCARASRRVALVMGHRTPGIFTAHAHVMSPVGLPWDVAISHRIAPFCTTLLPLLVCVCWTRQ